MSLTRLIEEGLRKLLLEKNLVANQVPDAWLASLALSLSEPFVTFDKDFKSLLPRSLLVLLPAGLWHALGHDDQRQT